MANTECATSYECIAIDLNTQHDFCRPDGTCPVTNAREVYPLLQRIVSWLRLHEIPMVSSIDSRRAHEIHELGRTRYCVDGSKGQQKVDFTLMPLRQIIEIDNTLAVPPNLLHQYQQLIFRKRTDDLLCNAKADRFLTQVNADKVYIFGNTIERSVKVLALGLLARDKKVSIVTDACGCWSKDAAHWALRQIVTKGGELTTVDDLTAMTPTQKYHRNGKSIIKNGESKRNGTNNHLGANLVTKGNPLSKSHEEPNKSDPEVTRHAPGHPGETSDSRANSDLL